MRVPAAKSVLVTSLAERAKAKGVAGDWAARATAAYNAKVLPALDAQMALLTSLQGKATHDAGVRSPNGDDHEKLTSDTSAPAGRSWTPAPKRAHDRSLKAR